METGAAGGPFDPADGQAILCPGLFDIQVNGFAGVDFNHAQFRAGMMEKACRAMLSTGVTGFFPTLITNSYERLNHGVTEIAKARGQSRLVQDMVKGIHIEGPHICADDGPRGAHPREHVRPPDWEAFKRIYDSSQGLIRLITLAPETPGALEFIRRAAKLGVVAAMGHCAPEPEIIQQAIDAGALLSTHLGNGSHEMLPRHSNHIQVQMARDELMASIICDGHHLPHYFVQNLVRAKGPDKVILITDATSAAGSPPGRYSMGDLELEAGPDGVLRLPGTPYLAGSTLTMDRAVMNCARAAGIDPATVLDMATLNPAKLFPGNGGLLAAGQPGDVIRLKLHQGGMEIIETYVGGQLVYPA